MIVGGVGLGIVFEHEIEFLYGLGVSDVGVQSSLGSPAGAPVV